MRRFAHALAVVATLTLLASACASDKDTGLPVGPTEGSSAPVCTGEVDMNDQLKFDPASCTVKVGATVTWKTVGEAPHTATSGPESPVKFDSGIVEQNGEFKFTFETAGEVPYVCTLHAGAGMVGTITVEA